MALVPEAMVESSLHIPVLALAVMRFGSSCFFIQVGCARVGGYPSCRVGRTLLP